MKVKELIEILFYAFNPDALSRKMLFIALKTLLKEGGEDGRVK